MADACTGCAIIGTPSEAEIKELSTRWSLSKRPPEVTNSAVVSSMSELFPRVLISDDDDFGAW